MRNIFNSRPSVATVLSLIALFAALGGTSYAAATISGKQVKNGTLTGADIKNNTVGGADVKESKLGQVPSAAKAAPGHQGHQRRSGRQGHPGRLRDQRRLGRHGQGRRHHRCEGGRPLAGRGRLHAGQRQPDRGPAEHPRQRLRLRVVPTGQNLAGATVSVSAGESVQFANGGLSIHAAKSNIDTSFRLVACNMTAAAINPAAAPFDYTAVK